MEKIHNSPPTLRRKLFITALAGMVCRMIAIAR